MKIALSIAAVLLLAVLSIVVIGALTSREHRTSIERDYGVPSATLYGLVRDYESYPAWRSGVKGMRRDGENRFIEVSGHGEIPYRVVEDMPSSKLVSVIDDPALPFSGKWTFEVVDKGQASSLRITEEGSVPNPVYRFFSRYVFSHEKTIRTYLDDVGRRLAQ